MGSFDRKTFSISDALFTKTQQQLLRLLFGQPEKSFYSKEIVDKAGIGTGTVLRELEKLSTAGLVTVKKIGNQKHYQANPSSPVFDELKGIVRKTFGLADPLHLALEQFKNKIKVAFIYGSVAKGSDNAESDIDLMLISDQLTYPDLLVSFSELEPQLGRQLNPTIYTVEEFRSKMIAENSFVVRVIEQPKIFLIGSKDDLPTV
ncbi:transcriptional regulator [Desulfuromonas acetexigens]|uniref:Transcriptional regulator n=2 Tax=Trichloromonas acetexigens TaxID=38815 RepID=A0A550J7H8_9BACT|nr:transcriptional regulator [Desulfuromonas acetexigens]